MDILDEEILNLWKSLYSNRVIYIMVGGFATNLHGFSRTTADLNIWIKDTHENRENLKKVLSGFGLGPFENIQKMEFVPGWTSINLPSGFELDIMTYMKAFNQNDFNECYEKAPVAIIADIPIHFLHINHLITEKRKCGRPKDQIDLMELEKIKNQ